MPELLYSAHDFSQYYRGAWIRVFDKPAKVHAVREDYCELRFLDGNAEMVEHPKIQKWSNLALPRLGWRSMENGLRIAYISRMPNRNTIKGLNVAELVFWTPPEFAAMVHKHFQKRELNAENIQDGQIAKLIFSPGFVCPEIAIEKMLVGDLASACISYNLAFVAGKKDRPIDVYYKRALVGHIKTNSKFVPDRPENLDIPELTALGQ